MEKTVSVADANREFAQLVRAVRAGCSFTVTSHGKPIARIIPADAPPGAAAGARQTLLARLEQQPTVEVGRWRRDELYDDTG